MTDENPYRSPDASLEFPLEPGAASPATPPAPEKPMTIVDFCITLIVAVSTGWGAYADWFSPITSQQRGSMAVIMAVCIASSIACGYLGIRMVRERQQS